MRFFHKLGIYSAIFSLVLITPYFYITGFDIIGIGSGGEGEIGVSPSPSGSPPTIEVEVPPTPSGGGGGRSININVDPLNFNVNLIINTNIQKIITVTNLRSDTSIIGISQEGLDGMIILPSSLSIGGGESKNITVTFVALGEAGSFAGKIKIGNKEILVSLNVKEKLLLFDSNIVVLNNNYLVKQGSELKTEVTLISLGDKERLDVTLNYAIKDFDGKVFLTKTETLLIEDKKVFKLNFDTGLLPLGDYVVELELVYPNGVATSSASFKVIEKIPLEFSLGSVLYYLIMLTLICAILIVGLLLQEVTREKETNPNLSY